MQALEQWLTANGYGEIDRQSALGGGCINDTKRVDTSTGDRFCLKQNRDAPLDFFASEAQGLAALQDSASVRVPEVIHHSSDFLLLEYIAEGKKANNFWALLAQQLANCHLRTKDQFGFHANNYCGLTPQINSLCADGYEFFSNHRLLIQSQWARDKKLLTQNHCRRIEMLCRRLPELIPIQQPALIHGDLWSGNLHCDEQGRPVLIDPACYWGWPEADLAMTSLFGGFAEDFYQLYVEHHKLEQGWRERFEIYNLYHLLNHLNLFGGGYVASVEAVLGKYS